MTQWTIHAQFDSDPRRNGKLRVLRHETAESENHVIASNVKPDIAPLIAAAPDMLWTLEQVDTYLSPMDGEEDVYAEIRGVIHAAIAKAKGA